MYVILVTLLASLISGAATAMPQIRHGQVVIKDDPGGEIYAFADRWDQIKAKGVPVKIDGRCSSSCTMGLSNPNVCVTPRAQFDFHLAYTTAMHKTKDGRWIEGRELLGPQGQRTNTAPALPGVGESMAYSARRPLQSDEDNAVLLRKVVHTHMPLETTLVVLDSPQ